MKRRREETVIRAACRFDRRAFCKAVGVATAVGAVEASLGRVLAHADLTKEQRDKMTPDEVIQHMKAGKRTLPVGQAAASRSRSPPTLNCEQGMATLLRTALYKRRAPSMTVKEGQGPEKEVQSVAGACRVTGKPELMYRRGCSEKRDG